MGVLVISYSLALRRQLQRLLSGCVDSRAVVFRLVIAVTARWLVVCDLVSLRKIRAGIGGLTYSCAHCVTREVSTGEVVKLWSTSVEQLEIRSLLSDF